MKAKENSKLDELISRYPTLGPDLVREIYREGWEAASRVVDRVHSEKQLKAATDEQAPFAYLVGIDALWSAIDWELRKGE